MVSSRRTAARYAVRRPRVPTRAFVIGIVVTILGCGISVAEAGLAPASDSATAEAEMSTDALTEASGLSSHVEPLPPAYVSTLPGVTMQAAERAGVCDQPAVVEALASGNDEAVVQALGGGFAFRDAVSSGVAPCLSLRDPNRVWVVVNKHYPLDPTSFEPSGLRNSSLRGTSGSLELRGVVADQLEAMAQGVADAGAGRLGLNNGYRPYWLQERNYNTMVRQSGRETADRRSARPGYSEHQTALTLDAVGCSTGCGSIDAFASTREGAWVKENAWKYGFIVRYEEGMTDITGYISEPWHLRYIGPGLAAAYREGGYRTLEEFFGLEAAPGYLN